MTTSNSNNNNTSGLESNTLNDDLKLKLQLNNNNNNRTKNDSSRQPSDRNGDSDVSKYAELQTKLQEAEKKNAYLTSLLAQLQTHQRNSANSATRVKIREEQPTVANHHLPKLTVKHIYSTEPLLIRYNESDEPRAPNHEESKSLIKTLFDQNKQQKQQVSQTYKCKIFNRSNV